MSKTPIVHPVSWTAAAIQLVLIVCLVAIGNCIDGAQGGFVAICVYLVVSATSRRLIAAHHRKAISHARQGEFDAAILEYEHSLAFFNQHVWVDRWRALTMFSVSGMSYREMAFLGLALCHGQLGDGEAARRYYELCLDQFPESGMAKAALNLMNAARDS